MCFAHRSKVIERVLLLVLSFFEKRFGKGWLGNVETLPKFKRDWRKLVECELSWCEEEEKCEITENKRGESVNDGWI